jgi:4'-phosphopantetheinyl transferase
VSERIDLWRVSLGNKGADDACWNVLSSDERERARRYVFARDRDRFVRARSALRHILSSYAGASPVTLRFRYGSHGKPALVSARQLHFNLSHADDAAVVAVGDAHPLGIDLERVRRLPDMAGMMNVICSEGERRRLETAHDMAGVFWRLWTGKEAILKAMGAGFSLAPCKIDLAVVEQGNGVFQTTAGEGLAREWQLHQLAPAEGFVGALALRADAEAEIGNFRDYAPARRGPSSTER